STPRRPSSPRPGAWARRARDAARGRRRDGPLPRRIVRLRRGGVRRRHLVRPLPVDPRGPPHPAARGPAALPRHLAAVDAVRAARRLAAARRPAGAGPLLRVPLLLVRGGG